MAIRSALGSRPGIWSSMALIGLGVLLPAAVARGSSAARPIDAGTHDRGGFLSEPTGACCLPDGGCSVTSEAECFESGGLRWTEGADCQDDCPPTGACCLPDGACAILIEDACENDGGFFQGDGAPCDGALCRVVRCWCYPPNNDPRRRVCVTKRTCDGAGWKWHGGEVCGVDGRGACCLPDGTCVFESQVECIAAGGVFQGPDVPCDPLTCTLSPTGACCLADGQCRVLDEEDCALAGGAGWTAFADCAGDCAPAGACCLPDGTCADVTEDFCGAIGGQFRGTGTPCGDDVCVPVPVSPGSWGRIRALYR